MIGGLVFVFGAQVHALDLSVTTTANMQSSGTASGSMNVDLGNGGLQAQVNAGTVNASSGDAIVSLQGNSVGLIQTDADLTAYNDLVVKSRPAVSSVNVQSDNSIDIGYAQPAKFLGIFSTSLSGDVHVDAQGNATVRMPWYSFLYSKDTSGVQTSVVTSIQQSGVQFGVQAQVNATTAAQNNARVINAATAAIQAQAQASATTSASASGY